MRISRSEEWRPEHVSEFVIGGFELSSDVDYLAMTTTQDLESRTEEPIGASSTRLYVSVKSTAAADAAMRSLAKEGNRTTALTIMGTDPDGVRRWEGTANLSRLEWTFYTPAKPDRTQMLAFGLLEESDPSPGESAKT